MPNDEQQNDWYRKKIHITNTLYGPADSVVKYMCITRETGARYPHKRAALVAIINEPNWADGNFANPTAPPALLFSKKKKYVHIYSSGTLCVSIFIFYFFFCIEEYPVWFSHFILFFYFFESPSSFNISRVFELCAKNYPMFISSRQEHRFLAVSTHVSKPRAYLSVHYFGGGVHFFYRPDAQWYEMQILVDKNISIKYLNKHRPKCLIEYSYSKI